MANILDGKLLSQTIRQELSKESKAFEQLHGRVPGLAVLLIGENPASKIYVRNKKKACEDCGFYSEVLEFPKDVRQEEIAETICRLNGDDRIDGILIQLPLPDHIDKAALINIIDPQKDVDAFHSLNVGRLFIGQYLWAPCTPAGVMEMLHRAGISVAGKKCVVVGRSNLVGKPMGAAAPSGKRYRHPLPFQNRRFEEGMSGSGYSGGRSGASPPDHRRYGETGCRGDRCGH